MNEPLGRDPQMPTAQEMVWFHQGFNAHERQAQPEDCPHWDNKRAADWWHMGWQHAHTLLAKGGG